MTELTPAERHYARGMIHRLDIVCWAMAAVIIVLVLWMPETLLTWIPITVIAVALALQLLLRYVWNL